MVRIIPDFNFAYNTEVSTTNIINRKILSANDVANIYKQKDTFL